MLMHPQLLLRSPEADDQNVRLDRSDLRQDPLVFGIVLFKPERRTVSADHLDSRPPGFDGSRGTRIDFGARSQQVNTDGRVRVATIKEQRNKIAACDAFRDAAPKDPGQ